MKGKFDGQKRSVKDMDRPIIFFFDIFTSDAITFCLVIIITYMVYHIFITFFIFIKVIY